MQIKTTVRYHYTPTRTAKISNNDNTNNGGDAKNLGLSYIAGGSVKWYNHSKNLCSRFLTRQNVHLSYDSVLALMGIYPREMKLYSYKNVYIISLFAFSWNWKGPKCLSIGWWLNKLWDMHTMGYYSATNKLLIHATTWMDLENVLLSVKSQSLKTTYCMSPFI